MDVLGIMSSCIILIVRLANLSSCVAKTSTNVVFMTVARVKCVSGSLVLESRLIYILG